MEGKSTFFVEMEEILEVVSEGSNNSLALIDELGKIRLIFIIFYLGRGTGT